MSGDSQSEEHSDNFYDQATISSCCVARPCGCKVGLLSDIESMPRRQSQHMGSLVNPWIVIPCEKHK